MPKGKKQYCGVSCTKIHNARRFVDREFGPSLTDLLSGGMNIKEACKLTNQNYRGFIRVLRDMYGITPSQYKESVREMDGRESEMTLVPKSFTNTAPGAQSLRLGRTAGVGRYAKSHLNITGNYRSPGQHTG